MYLIFSTKEQAETANQQITSSMGLNGNITTKWAEVEELEDGTFKIPEPEPRFMTGVITERIE